MALQKPWNINLKDKVIDSSNDVLVSWSTSGDISSSFSINIYNNETGTLTYQLPRTYSYAMSYIIPSGSIVNGFDYKISITVWNSVDESATSQFVIFTTSSSPVVTVPPIGTVNNHSYLFTASYSQAENVEIRSYVVNLYNSNQVLIKSSGIKIDTLLEYRFDLMKNDTNYFVEFVVTSKKGLVTSSGLIGFTVTYENPSLYFELSKETIPEKASVKLNWKVRQVTGKTSVNPIYLNNEELDVRSGKVFYDEGFELLSDFTLKIWFREIAVNTDLIYLKGSNGELRLQYKPYDSCFHLYKKVNGYNYHYTLPMVISNESVFLCVQQKTGTMDMYSEKY